MLYIIPDYYKEFQCTAADCEDTCCAGWQIMIDEKSLNRYKKAPGHFGKRLRRSIHWKEGAFRQHPDKRCAFLNDENLCDLYTALGERALCQTCKRYPRHIEEFENVREISLSVSCPEVARILMSKDEPVQFLEYERDGEEAYDDFDPFLYSALMDTRDVMLRILQNRELSVAVRAMLIIGIAHDIQIRVNHGELFSCQEVLEKYEKESAIAFVKEKYLNQDDGYWQKQFESSKEMFSFLEGLEKLRVNWEVTLYETRHLLYEEGLVGYREHHREFAEWLSGEGSDLKWEIKAEQLLVYFIYTYFCGAVYDARVYGKAQLAVSGVFVIYEMLMARWIKNEKTLYIEDILDTVYRFSREIEHSDDNLELAEKKLRFKV